MTAPKPPTRAQRDAAARVAAIDDPIAECGRRWGDFSFDVRTVPELDGCSYLQVTATWTHDGHDNGLRELLPLEAPPIEVTASKERIAFAALYNDERRRSS